MTMKNLSNYCKFQ